MKDIPLYSEKQLPYSFCTAISTFSRSVILRWHMIGGEYAATHVTMNRRAFVWYVLSTVWAVVAIAHRPGPQTQRRLETR